MNTTSPESRLPDTSTRRVLRGPERLQNHEVKWRDRQRFLESKGYMLRPRLRPGWTPSWKRTGERIMYSEDASCLPLRPMLVDATRISDGKLVYIKQFETDDLESRIAMMLGALEDPTNHSVPILDTFVDDADETISYIVMPFLRLSDSPPFDFVEELLDFVDQILEGLVFMHSQGVAHRDCDLKNILMDGSNMFPLGFHPVRDIFLADYVTPATHIPRLDAGVRYYFVDYGISSYFPPGSQRQLVLGTDGRDQDVPELSNDVPYDPFKVDIFTIGNNLRIEFQAKYSNLGFFTPLIEYMTQNEPSARPSAEDALKQWKSIRRRIYLLHRYWRPRERKEPLLIVVILDIVHALGFLPRFAKMVYRTVCLDL
ncbi:kinase-like domain-containing protein [Gloeopeniophorella convolvens]|nr:kinase-like domain-containing protein [Gloeopeniophorella convolvens]